MSDIASLSVLLLVSMLPTAIVTVAMLHVNKRLAAENRELLKANLTLSQQPAAVALAHAMEGTDRHAATTEAQVRNANPQRGAPRLVGS